MRRRRRRRWNTWMKARARCVCLVLDLFFNQTGVTSRAAKLNLHTPVQLYASPKTDDGLG
jgi:hypothetical protein